MGYQSGFGNDVLSVVRTGYCYNPDPDAADPTWFRYDLADSPFVESWGQGLAVFHNPKCLHPLPRDFFADAVQFYMEDGQLKSDGDEWYPLTSITKTVYFEAPSKRLPWMPPIWIEAIPKRIFRAITGFETSIGFDDGLFADDAGNFMGVVICVGAKWAYVILARENSNDFRIVASKDGFSWRKDAREYLQVQMAQLVASK